MVPGSLIQTQPRAPRLFAPVLGLVVGGEPTGRTTTVRGLRQNGRPITATPFSVQPMGLTPPVALLSAPQETFAPIIPDAAAITRGVTIAALTFLFISAFHS